MKFSTGLIAGAAAVGFSVVSGAPLAIRTAINDGDILNYALTLEHLENSFYSQMLQKHPKEDFLAAGFSKEFYENILVIAADEATHVDFLQKGLVAAGVVPVEPCTYSFPLDTVEMSVATASVLEGVGVTAYLGAAASIMDKNYLTAAGSILTVESRHSSYIRGSIKQAPFPQPFDTPLSFNDVFSLAIQFIVECPPNNPSLPFKAFPVLVFMPAEGEPEIKSGNSIHLSTAAPNIHDYENIHDSKYAYAAFITVTGPIFANTESTGNGNFVVTVPEGINGQSYVVLTSSNESVTDDNTIAGPAIIEITNF